jgi:hypothetical protein
MDLPSSPGVASPRPGAYTRDASVRRKVSSGRAVLVAAGRFWRRETLTMRIRHLLAALAALTLSATLVQPVMADKHHKHQNYQHQNYKHQNYQHDYKNKNKNYGHHYGQQKYKHNYKHQNSQ